ncbi:polyprenyl synthetase family protein [Arthrobacter zhaoxinii]|uniref:Polyprenyl synthetase family protein n=1 Tax=Arthrobacter zhaoxinii TaxID=2964616 RepID=A0ABY5YTC5_9MICC|nr:polyprenyl synthetase family protein [Arthrobacter zhaoxinii]UWX98367.1 polyprenyl synthetase family protein [Arthrobacter zhaoxinii]
MNFLNTEYAVETDTDLGLVEDVLDWFFTDAKLRAVSVHPAYLSLWEAIERSAASGKRFRPRLLLLAYRQLGGMDSAAAARLGAAYELLHNAFLIHDDVIDRDVMRHGVPNVSGHYSNKARRAGASAAAAQHAGMASGLLAGDLVLAGAYRLHGSVETCPKVREELNGILDYAVFSTIGGELLDVEFARAAEMPSPEEIRTVARHKTSVYSFEAPLQAGAVLAGATASVAATLAAFGRDAGIAYQIADDVLGVFGQEQHTGKTNWGDLREGKRTAMLSYAATKPQWKQISELIGSDRMTAAEAQWVRALLRDCGAQEHAVQLASEHAQAALKQLGDEVPAGLGDSLESLLSSVLAGLHSL